MDLIDYANLSHNGKLSAEELSYAIKIFDLEKACHTLRRTFFQKYKEIKDDLTDLQIKMEEIGRKDAQ